LDDYLIMGSCSILGLLVRHYKFSLPGLLKGFILSERIETLTIQLSTLYSPDMLLNRPKAIKG